MWLSLISAGFALVWVAHEVALTDGARAPKQGPQSPRDPCRRICNEYINICVPTWLDPWNFFIPHCEDVFDNGRPAVPCILCLKVHGVTPTSEPTQPMPLPVTRTTELPAPARQQTQPPQPPQPPQTPQLSQPAQPPQPPQPPPRPQPTQFPQSWPTTELELPLSSPANIFTPTNQSTPTETSTDWPSAPNESGPNGWNPEWESSDEQSQTGDGEAQNDPSADDTQTRNATQHTWPSGIADMKSLEPTPSATTTAVASACPEVCTCTRVQSATTEVTTSFCPLEHDEDYACDLNDPSAVMTSGDESKCECEKDLACLQAGGSEYL